MARITVEDCLEKVENRFHLVRVASKRARQTSAGRPDAGWIRTRLWTGRHGLAVQVSGTRWRILL